jgi:hypothetical protein
MGRTDQQVAKSGADGEFLSDSERKAPVMESVTLVAEVDWPSVRAHVERLNDING